MTDRPEIDETPRIYGEIGEEFRMHNHELLKPLEGKLVDATLFGGKIVKARVISVDQYTSKLKVVSPTIKE